MKEVTWAVARLREKELWIAVKVCCPTPEGLLDTGPAAPNCMIVVDQDGAGQRTRQKKPERSDSWNDIWVLNCGAVGVGLRFDRRIWDERPARCSACSGGHGGGQLVDGANADVRIRSNINLMKMSIENDP